MRSTSLKSNLGVKCNCDIPRVTCEPMKKNFHALRAGIFEESDETLNITFFKYPRRRLQRLPSRCGLYLVDNLAKSAI